MANEDTCLTAENPRRESLAAALGPMAMMVEETPTQEEVFEPVMPSKTSYKYVSVTAPEVVPSSGPIFFNVRVGNNRMSIRYSEFDALKSQLWWKFIARQLELPRADPARLLGAQLVGQREPPDGGLQRPPRAALRMHAHL